MRRWFTVLAFLTVFFMVRISVAEEPPRRAQIQHEGVDGIWFRMDVARELMAFLQETAALNERVELLEQGLRLRDQELFLVRGAITACAEESTRLSRVLQVAERQRREAVEARDAWYRNPFLWGGVGFLGGLGSILLVLSLT